MRKGFGPIGWKTSFRFGAVRQIRKLWRVMKEVSQENPSTMKKQIAALLWVPAIQSWSVYKRFPVQVKNRCASVAVCLRQEVFVPKRRSTLATGFSVSTFIRTLSVARVPWAVIAFHTRLKTVKILLWRCFKHRHGVMVCLMQRIRRQIGSDRLFEGVQFWADQARQ